MNILSTLNLVTNLLNEGVSDMWKRLRFEGYTNEEIEKIKSAWNVVSKALSGKEKDSFSFQNYFKKEGDHTPQEWVKLIISKSRDILNSENKKRERGIKGRDWSNKNTIKVVWEDNNWYIFCFMSFGGLSYFRDNCMIECKDDNFTEKPKVSQYEYFNSQARNCSLKEYAKEIAELPYYMIPSWCISKSSNNWESYGLSESPFPRCYLLASKLHANWKIIYTLNADGKFSEIRDLWQTSQKSAEADDILDGIEGVDKNNIREIIMKQKRSIKLRRMMKPYTEDFQHNLKDLIKFEESIDKVKDLLSIPDVDLSESTSIITAMYQSSPSEELVNLLIEKGANINLRREDTTPLMTFVANSRTLNQSQRFGFIDYLLGKGAYIDLPLRTGETPMSFSIQTKDDDLLKHLIKMGADVNKRVIRGKKGESQISLLSLAVMFKNDSAIDILLKNGATLDIKPSDSSTPLFWCVHTNNKKAFEKLYTNEQLDMPCRVNTLGSNETIKNPLTKAIEMLNTQMVSLLLKKGASMEPVNNKSILAYFSTSEKRSLFTPSEEINEKIEKILKILISYGLEINNKALADLIENKNYEIIPHILKYGVDLKTSSESEAIAHLLLRDHAFGILKDLVKKGLPTDGLSQQEMARALRSSMDDNRLDDADVLFDIGLDKNYVFKEGRLAGKNIIDLIITTECNDDFSLYLLKKDIKIKDIKNLLQSLILSGSSKSTHFLLEKYDVDVNEDIGTPYGTYLNALTEAVHPNENILKDLLEHGAKPNISNYRGINPLEMIISRHSIKNKNELCDILYSYGAYSDKALVRQVQNYDCDEFIKNIKNGANPNTYTNTFTHSTLFDALGVMIESEGNEDNIAKIKKMFDTMLKYGADINMADERGRTPLVRSIINRNDKTFNLLLHGEGVQLYGTEDSYSPLTHAIRSRNTYAVNGLLKAGVDPNTPEPKFYKPKSTDSSSNDPSLEYPLYSAIDECNEKCVSALLKHGAKVYQKGSDYMPLFEAVSLDNFQIVELLLKHGANPNEVYMGNSVITQLFDGLKEYTQNFEKIYNILIEYGADVRNRVTYSDEYPLLLLALYNTNTTDDMLDYLFSKGYSIEDKLPNGKTIIQQYFTQGKHSVSFSFNYNIDKLLANNVNLRITNGQTPLHYAVKTRNQKMLIELLQDKKYVDVDARDDFGKTPLYYVFDGQKSDNPMLKREGVFYAKALLNKGASPLIMASKSIPALYLFHDYGTIFETIASNEKIINQKIEDIGIDYLTFLIQGDYKFNIIDLVAHYPVNVNEYYEKSGQNVLWLSAIWNQDAQILETLIQNGADVNFVNRKKGMTLYQYLNSPAGQNIKNVRQMILVLKNNGAR